MRVPKAEKGLSKSQVKVLQNDVLEDDDEVHDRRALESGDESDSQMIEDDEEISSDEEEGGDLGMQVKRRHADDYDDDEQSLGSSLDGAELADLSHMLSDDEDEAPPTKESNSGMLRDIGLSTSRRARERTEAREEGEHTAPAGAQLSMDVLLGSLKERDGFGALKRDLQPAEKTERKRSSHSTLEAPLEPFEKKRVERRAATESVHKDVGGWDKAVKRNAVAEQLHFPAQRPAMHGTSSASLINGPAKGALEEGVEALLAAQGLGETALAQSEEDALRSLGSELTAEEAAAPVEGL